MKPNTVIAALTLSLAAIPALVQGGGPFFGGPSEAERTGLAEERFAAADADGAGQLTQDEMVAAAENAERQRRQERTARCFRPWTPTATARCRSKRRRSRTPSAGDSWTARASAGSTMAGQPPRTSGSRWPISAAHRWPARRRKSACSTERIVGMTDEERAAYADRLQEVFTRPRRR